MPQRAARQPISGEVRSLSWSRTFPGTREQAGEARRFLAALLGGSPLTDDAITCLGELASNAVLHSDSRLPGGTFTVRAELAPGRLRVAVEDSGGPWAPRPASGDPDSLSGRGLLIVAALAGDWDITPRTTATTRTAWFILRQPPEQGPRPGHTRQLAAMPGQPATAQARLPCPAEGRVQAVCDWLTSLERRQVRAVTLTRISRDLWPILSPAPDRPSGDAVRAGGRNVADGHQPPQASRALRADAGDLDCQPAGACGAGAPLRRRRRGRGAA